jgi:DNA-binding response OmpR family regulator
MKWRFLIVEDCSEFVRQLEESTASFVESPDTAEAKIVTTFSEAENLMKVERYDLLILDLKDSSSAITESDAEPAGLRIFESLKKTRFVPVIFYTAFPHKVRSLETSFIRVVEKTEGIGKLIEKIKQVIGTQLPALARKLEDVQRDYMWDFVST